MAQSSGAVSTYFHQAQATGAGRFEAADLALAAAVRDLVSRGRGGQVLADLVAQANICADSVEPDDPAVDATEPLMSVDQLAAMCGVSRYSVYQWNQAGTGPARIRVGRVVRYRPADVRAWLDSRHVA